MRQYPEEFKATIIAKMGNPLKVYIKDFYQTLTTLAAYKNQRFCTRLLACTFKKVSHKGTGLKIGISFKLTATGCWLL